MLFRQIVHEDLGCASYLVGDAAAGVAAVVDPGYEIEVYLDLARRFGVRIEHVLETHNHADHVSGHGRLVAATGATVHVHEQARPDYPHESFVDGWELRLGQVTVRAVHTPGHRPEHCAFLLLDEQRGGAPWALLSGDSLFVGGVARPDLAIERHDGARQIFRSLHERLLALPPDVELWPGHLGGSMCGGPGMDHKICSTIGFERAANPLLSVDEAEFVTAMVSELGSQPPRFAEIVALNRGPLVAGSAELPPLEPQQLAAARDGGALVVDVRDEREFAGGHVPGSVCNPIGRSGFGTRLAWLERAGRPVVLVAASHAAARRAVALAGAVGIQPSGYLRGGLDGWLAERRPVASTERITIEALDARRAVDPGLQIVDVRDRREWEAAHLPRARNVPWHEIDGLPDGVDGTRPLAVICGTGLRAAVAASLLQRAGAEQVWQVVGGGVAQWIALGRPVERLSAARVPA